MPKFKAARGSDPRRAALIVLAACAVFASGCTIEEPELPSFTTMATIPIGDHDITVSELIEDQDFLAAGADSAVLFAVDGDAETVALNVDLSTELAGADLDAALGDFVIDAPDPMAFAFRLDEMYPEAALLPPTPLPVPAFDFALESDPADIAGIESATVAAGRISVEIVNGLPVPISGDAPPEQLAVELIDPRYGSVITTLDAAGELPAGASGVWTADLAGVELPGEVSVRVAGGSPGSAAPVLVDPASSLEISVAIEDLTVAEASAVIGAQSISAGAVETLPDSLGVISAAIASGALDITVENGLPLACSAELSCPGMHHSDGSPLLVVVDLPPRGVTSVLVDLAGAGIQSPTDAPLTELEWSVSVSSAGSGGSPVTLRAQDRLLLDVAPATLFFDEITGIIPEQRFALDSMVESIDIPDELDGVTLTQAALTVEIMNDSGIDGELAVRLEGTSADGETAVLETTARIEPRKGPSPERTVIQMDADNSDITRFLQLMPEEYEMTGEVTVGGPGSVQTVRPGDSADISWRIDAPLRVMIENSEIHREAEPLDLDEDLREELDERIYSGRILTSVLNRFPFDVQVLFQVGADSVSAADSPGLVIGPLAVAGAPVDPATGYAKGQNESNHDIQLTREQIRVLTQPEAHTAVVALIPGTSGAEVALRIGDYLKVTGAVTAEILVEEDE